MKRNFTWAVFVGGILVVLGVLWQAFTIAAYVRGAGEGALDAHGTGSLVVHIGQLAIVIGALVAYWGNWNQVGLAIGFLALIVLISGLLYAQKAARELGIRQTRGAAGSA